MGAQYPLQFVGDKQARAAAYRIRLNSVPNSLSTLATIVADFGDNLSPKTATVAENCDSRRIRRQSPFSATVAVLRDSVDRASLSTLATIVADFGDKLSPKTATVAAKKGENW